MPSSEAHEVPQEGEVSDQGVSISKMQAELRRLTKLSDEFVATTDAVSKFTEESIASLRQTVETVEQGLLEEKHDRITNHGMLQRTISNFQYDFASERGDRNMLRSELAALRAEMMPHLALKQRLEGADAASTEACTNERASGHSDRHSAHGSDINEERISIGETASQYQESSKNAESGFLDVLSKKSTR